MPSWLSGLIENKGESVPRSNTPPLNPPTPIKETAARDVQKSTVNETIVAEEDSSSVLSLLKGKDNIQSSTLELIKDLAKKKRNIQRATITLVQDQLNSDLLIKVTAKQTLN